VAGFQYDSLTVRADGTGSIVFEVRQESRGEKSRGMRVMENVTEVRGEAGAATGPLHRSPVPSRTITPIARAMLTAYYGRFGIPAAQLTLLPPTPF
jgi:hypothetical protein